MTQNIQNDSFVIIMSLSCGCFSLHALSWPHQLGCFNICEGSLSLLPLDPPCLLHALFSGVLERRCTMACLLPHSQLFWFSINPLFLVPPPSCLAWPHCSLCFLCCPHCSQFPSLTNCKMASNQQPLFASPAMPLHTPSKALWMPSLWAKFDGLANASLEGPSSNALATVLCAPILSHIKCPQILPSAHPTCSGVHG